MFGLWTVHDGSFDAPSTYALNCSTLLISVPLGLAKVAVTELTVEVYADPKKDGISGYSIVKNHFGSARQCLKSQLR